MIELIQPHSLEWKKEFEQIKQLLTTELSQFVIDIEHVGSTAIENLVAKPILDIDIVLYNQSLIDELSIKLIQLGYINKGNQGIEGRFAFKQSNNKVPFSTKNKEWQKHHLYVCFADSLALKNHLLFRQALLSDTKIVEQYNNLKKKLVIEKGITKETYTKRKTNFIIDILSKQGMNTDELEAIKQANI